SHTSRIRTSHAIVLLSRLSVFVSNHKASITNLASQLRQESEIATARLKLSFRRAVFLFMPI
ncbi:MAG: hypothetical protein MR386_03795, partial [Prevotella sp.]|nr:hypothetical protein [Prevotella sp.]